jgi:AraC-like DNA-binding protein/mannose-6-phosphate isomerase-like protein (cupin superfamily)
VIRLLQYFVKEKLSSIFVENQNPDLLYVCEVDPVHAKMPRTMHVHEDRVEIVLIVEGFGEYTIHNNKYHVQKGDLLFFNSGVIHDEAVCEDQKILTYCAAIKNLQITGLGKNEILSNLMCPVIHLDQDFEKVKKIFLLLYDTVKEETNCKTEMSHYLMRAFVVKVHDCIEKYEVPIVPLPYNLGIQIKQYIDAHYLENLNLSKISEALHINTYYLSHVFKEMVGYSPMHYVMRRRVGEAQNLLINTEDSITKIAMRVGYNNSNYFQLVFSTIVGMSPGRYRKAWVKETDTPEFFDKTGK